MSDSTNATASYSKQNIPFKAETRQLLDILVHSLYTEREIFLRELISNASDALTRVDFEILTNREVFDPQAKLSIRISINLEEKTLTVSDTGIGMNADELVENLGTIAHSGARDFVTAAKSSDNKLSDIIGQFGVGFYSAFMVAEWIRVISHSHRSGDQAALWFSKGDDAFSIEPAKKSTRGTDVIVKIKEDASEFLDEQRLKNIVRKHSDFVPFPIYIGKEESEQVNQQTAIWRQKPRQIEQKEYDQFYKQLTLDYEEPLIHAHMVVDAPVQMYAVLYVPAKKERGLFMLRRDEGLKLYARNVLIQEYCKDLLPEYFRFIQGVVDSEDLPLNVSREVVQSTRVIAQLKKLVTTKVIDTLKNLAEEKPESYDKFWNEFGHFVKEGVAIEQSEPEKLHSLLRFHTTEQMERWSSVEDYVKRMKAGQEDIYYLLGEDVHSVMYSPHLDPVRKHNLEVLVFTDPVDAFMMMRFTKYQEHPLVNIANPELKLPKLEEQSPEEPLPALPVEEFITLVNRFKKQLGERVSDVRLTDRLTDAPARLVDPQGAPPQQFQRVYRILGEKFDPPKKILELNPRHAILAGLNKISGEDKLGEIVIEQLYEDTLLIEGIHPDPVSMIPRIQQIIETALGKQPIIDKDE